MYQIEKFEHEQGVTLYSVSKKGVTKTFMVGAGTIWTALEAHFERLENSGHRRPRNPGRRHSEIDAWSRTLEDE